MGLQYHCSPDSFLTWSASKMALMRAATNFVLDDKIELDKERAAHQVGSWDGSEVGRGRRNPED